MKIKDFRCLLMGLQALICFATISFGAQSADNGELIQVHVTDREGRAISNAEAAVIGSGATSQEMGHSQADGSGLIRIQLAASFRRSAFIVVTAQGYQPQQHPLRQAGMDELRVVLEARASGMPRVGNTVSAAELPETRQKKAIRFNQSGIAAYRRGDYAQAEHMFLQAISIAPSTSAPYNNMGVTMVQKREAGRSSEWFEKAYQLQPYDPVIMGNLGILRWSQARHAESVRLLERAVDSGFKNSIAHYVLGILELENGDWRRAEKELSSTPNEGFAFKHLFQSIAQVRLGRARAAAKNLSEFRKRNPVPYSIALIR